MLPSSAPRQGNGRARQGALIRAGGRPARRADPRSLTASGIRAAVLRPGRGGSPGTRHLAAGCRDRYRHNVSAQRGGSRKKLYLSRLIYVFPGRVLHREKVIWSTGSVVDRKHTPARRAFLDWHRAHLLGLRVESCEFEGRQLTPPELLRLNLWISARGAWRCSLLPLHEAHRVLREVIKGGLSGVGCGFSGAGRWSSRTRAATIFGFEFAERSKDQLRLDFGENA